MNEARQLFEHLLREHESDVIRVCRSIARDGHLAADASQETFLRLWRRIEAGFRPDRAGAWLHQVAVGVAVDLRRRLAQRSAEPLDERLGTLDRTDPIAEQELERDFQGALGTLSEGQRTVFLLRHDGGLSLPEIANALQLALPTVKTQFARAALKLQQGLRSYQDAKNQLRP